ncbi:hypothetical protein BGZ51_000519 [Haplosporangium sp. Z 767]|nr:hypothetical protein BGZ51_000519 [Haplosporangium sp. Z 767]
MTHCSGKESWRKEFDGIVNNEYFYALTSLAEIRHLDYFKYCSPRPSDKDALHRRWLNVILPKLKASKIQQVFDQHGRLVCEWLEQAAETKEYWDKRAEEEANDLERRLDRKHNLSLQANAVDQLDAQFQHYTKKVRALNDVPPVLSKSSHRAASSSTSDDWVFGASRPGPPARPASFDQAAAPSTTSYEFVSGPNRTTPPAPPVPFKPSPWAGAPLAGTDESMYSTTQTRPYAPAEPHKDSPRLPLGLADLMCWT